MGNMVISREATRFSPGARPIEAQEMDEVTGAVSGFWITRLHLAVRASFAMHNLTNAYHTDEALSNVEVLIENEGDAAVTRQCGGERVEDCG